MNMKKEKKLSKEERQTIIRKNLIDFLWELFLAIPFLWR